MHQNVNPRGAQSTRLTEGLAPAARRVAERHPHLRWPGNDLLRGGPLRDLLSGDTGSDRMFGGRGRDQLSVGPGSDLTKGGKWHDLIVNRSSVGGIPDDLAPDRVFGGPGDDRIDVAQELPADRVGCGRGGDDVLGTAAIRSAAARASACAVSQPRQSSR